MADPIGLHQLVEAITSAVIDAQDKIELHQLASLRRYFDEDKRPRLLSMLVPSLSHGSDKDVRITAPWLALVKPNPLAIKNLHVDMEIGLVDFSPQAAKPPLPPSGADGLPPRDTSGSLLVDVTSVSQSRKHNTAKIVLEVEGQEPSEGLARMILELVKRIRITDDE